MLFRSVLFGIFLFRTGAYPRLLCWAYLLFPALLALLSPLPDSPLKNVVHVLAGSTVGWLAVMLWRASPGNAPGTLAGIGEAGDRGLGRHYDPVRDQAF